MPFNQYYALNLDTDCRDRQHVMTYYTELDDMSQNPEALMKLCILTTRHHMPCKTDDKFARLGLPHKLLTMVNFNSLADDVNEMKGDTFHPGCN